MVFDVDESRHVIPSCVPTAQLCQSSLCVPGDRAAMSAGPVRREVLTATPPGRGSVAQSSLLATSLMLLQPEPVSAILQRL